MNKVTCLLTALFFVSVLNGCSTLQAGKLIAPSHFGMEQIAPDVYLETGADDASKTALVAAMLQAQQAVRQTYGSVVSRPVVHACLSESCYTEFGGRGSIAKIYGNQILLSPRGRNWHFLAHEWSHAELRARQTISAWLDMPQWFDEGIAVAVSDAPEHSENHWQYLVASNTPRPTPEELHSLKSLNQWLAAVHNYGEDRNVERKQRGEPEIRPVYSAAGHELRNWLAKAGSSGLFGLIARMNAGQDFESAFAAETALAGQAAIGSQ